MQMDLWQRGCERLAAELPAQQFNTWFRPLPPAEVSAAGDGYLVGLRVPNRFKMDWIRSQFATRIERLLSEIAGKPVRLELSLGNTSDAVFRPPEPPAPAPRLEAPVQMSMIDFLPLPIDAAPAPPSATASTTRSGTTRSRARAVLNPTGNGAAGPAAPSPVPPPAARAGRTPSSMPGLHELLTLPAAHQAPSAAPKPAPRATSARRTATATPPAAAKPPPEPAPATPVSTTAPMSSSAISAASALAKASAAVASRRKRVAASSSKSAEAAAPTQAPAAPPAAAPESSPAPSASRISGSPTIIIPTVPPPTAPSVTRGRINPALTFDTLVPGRANQMARTAALHVVGSPGGMYNPLFLYGGVGLGKTHLIHAVGNALLKEHKDARVLYLHAEQFIS
ncbi:MAG: chromosomal replication initiator protein DnaA, partial [Pseudomonadota bacterium]